MPQKLDSLKVNEVSLCDFPANASIDPRTGKKIAHAVVAIKKRDDTYTPIRVRAQRLSDAVRKNERTLAEALSKSKKCKEDGQDRNEQLLQRRKKKMPKLKTILKSSAVESSPVFTRDDLYQAVEKKARKVALKKNISPELAESRIWESIYKTSSLMDPPELRREPKMMRVTKAEAELDKRGRALMKSNPGLGYAQACSAALQADPALYTKYTKEISTPGATYLVPEASQPDFSEIGKLASGDSDDEDDCPQCGEDVDDGDKFCAACGADLKKSKRR